jgi:hypothetical protein
MKIVEMPLITKIILLCIAVDYSLASITHKGSNKNADEIPDFEFDDNFPVEKSPTSSSHHRHHNQHQSHSANLNFNDFDDFFIDDGESESDSSLDFGSKEKMMKDAILRALSTKELKYKFSEVLPLLRHLSKAQRMVFSSIISAQINGGRSFTFDEASYTNYKASYFSLRGKLFN